MLIWQHKGLDLIKHSHLPAHLLCCPLMSKFALVADDADSGINSWEYNNEQTPYNNVSIANIRLFVVSSQIIMYKGIY